MSRKSVYGLAAPMMQSFTSIGPFLDFVAIFSVVAIYAGVMLPLVILLSFLLGYSTINTVYRLSSLYSTNGGYYAYVGKVLGKDAGIVIAFMYLGYSALVLPDISMFIGSFTQAVFSPLFSLSALDVAIVSISFAALILFFASRDISLRISYTMVSGSLEAVMLVLTSILFFLHSNGNISGALSGGGFRVNGIWLGLVFGILGFAGSGSSIFLSRNVNDPRKTIPKSLLTSYSFSGIIMVISSLSLLLFIGRNSIESYSFNPLAVLSLIRTEIGLPFFAVFAIFVISSASNLVLSYLTALKNAFSEITGDGIIALKSSRRISCSSMLLAVFLVSSVSVLAGYFSMNYFYVFTVIAGAVSLTYMVVHAMANISLMRMHSSFTFTTALLLPAVSTLILAIAFYYSFLNGSYSILYANILFLSIVALSFLYLVIIRMDRKRYHSVAIGIGDDLS